MLRKIIEIDAHACNGCGACVLACHEGAIALVDGKATLLRDDYCDGLGDCLPSCPMDAIHFTNRDTAAYDAAAVQAHIAQRTALDAPERGCRSTRVASLHPTLHSVQATNKTADSALAQWPIQIKLVPVHAPFFDNANVLVAADCSAYAYANFHEDFIKDKITLIGCPKLDMVDYASKLTEIFRSNQIRSITVVRMEVPCCAGLQHAVQTALQNAHVSMPCHVVTIAASGAIVADV